MKVSWNYSPETEAQHLIWTAYQIQNGFYYSKGWLLLPYFAPRQSRTVYFPKKQYHKIPNFWQNVSLIRAGLLFKNPKFAHDVASFLDSQTINFQKLKTDWEKVHNDFIKELTTIMPGIFDGVETIEIRPTGNGVCSTSFSRYVHQNNPEKHIVCYVRNDMDYSQIAECILLDRMNKDNRYSIYTWEEKEAIMDFLIQNTRLAKLFPHHAGTIKSLRQNQHAKYVVDSNTYYKHFGFDGSLFEQKDDGVYVKGKLLNLSPIEEKVMRKLLLHSGHVVTFDAIARVMWNKDTEDRYSLYAISKQIERLRKKIEKYGVFPDSIQTKRGVGYLIVG